MKEGKRFYIGSKQECSLEMFDGVMTVLDRYEKPYYSSSTSIEMQEQMKRGDVFEASALEWVGDKKNLLEIENKYINEVDAVFCEEYYNKSNALMNVHDQTAVANKFGETVKDLACRNSSLSKRDSTAKKLGFDNFGEFHLWVRDQMDQGVSHPAMCEKIGKHRHFSQVSIKGIDLDKVTRELLEKDKHQVELRRMIACGCSFYYATELLGLELSSARIMLGDFNKKHQRAFKASLKVGKTKQEMEEEIVRIILTSKDGEGYKDAAHELNIGMETVRRYLSRYLKKNLPYPKK